MELQDSTISFLGLSLFFPAFTKQLFLAAIFGLVFGFERAIRQKVASLRTFSIICTGSCLFAILSVEVAGHSTTGPYDVTRIAAGIVTGIGFVGGGVIFKTHDKIAGITTAAMIWMASAVGMSIGFNNIGLSMWGMIVYLFILYVSIFLHRMIRRFNLEVKHFRERHHA